MQPHVLASEESCPLKSMDALGHASLHIRSASAASDQGHTLSASRPQHTCKETAGHEKQAETLDLSDISIDVALQNLLAIRGSALAKQIMPEMRTVHTVSILCNCRSHAKALGQCDGNNKRMLSGPPRRSARFAHG